MAYYLTYRPQSIAELDEVKVREQLVSILGAKAIPHAFLFVGPKGTGKTSSARILAKVVNCLKPKNSGVACNNCAACDLINQGTTLDLIEIDAASNRGIDDIRELRERVKLAPSVLKYKIYIIDEVHMLTNEAFNALLKTLEEPPAHVKFVLATTQFEKLPDTIVSRCFKVEFTKATKEELIGALTKVVKGEGLKIGNEDLAKIATASDGSFRDAVKWLELLAAGGKVIKSTQVDDLINQGVAGKPFDAWLTTIYQGQVNDALTWLKDSLDKGTDVRLLALRLTERLRELLLIKLKVVSGDDLPAIAEVNKLLQLTELMHQASREVKTAVITSLPLELAIISWGQSETTTDNIPQEVVNTTPMPTIKKSPPQPAPVKVATKSGKLDLNEVRSQWSEILKAMRPHNHSLEALLRACQPHGFEGQYLVLDVFYQFHKDRLEVDKYRRLVEEVISGHLGSPVRIKYLLTTKSDNLSSVENDNDIIKTAEEIFGTN